MANQVTLHAALSGAAQVGAGLKGIRAEAVGLGSGFAGIGAKAEKGLSGMGNALGHAKSQITGLMGGLGLLAGGAGLLGVGSVLTSSVEKANAFGLSVYTLGKVTHTAAEPMSALLAVFGKYGIEADTAGRSLGMLEKNAFNLTSTTKKAASFTKDYGFALRDASGQVKDANTLVLQAADYFVKSGSAAQAASLEAKLFGKSWMAMVPVLSLGSKGILEAEQAAKDLGLTLTQQNVTELAAYRKSTRDLGEAWGALQLQIGLAVIPAVKDLSVAMTGFVTGNKDKIIGFFKEGIQVARGFGQVVTGTIIPTLKSVAGAAIGMWNMIPGPIKDLLVGTYVTNRVVKFLFGVDVVGSIGKVLGGAIAGAVGKSVSAAVAGSVIGKAFVQPVFVTNMGVGGLGGVAGAGGAVEGAAAGASVATAAIAAMPIVAGAAIVYLASQNKGAYDPRDLHRRQGTTVAQTTALFGAPAIQSPTFGFGNSERAGMAALPKAVTALDKTAGTMSTLQKQLHADFREAIGALRKASDPAAILAAAARVTKDMLGGVGNVAQTKGTVADLTAKRDALLKAGEKAAAATISAEIRKLEALMPGRAHQAALLAQGAKIVASSESAKKKIADLTVIENQLKALHRTTAAAAIQKQIETIRAINATTAAVNDIRLPYTIKPGDIKPTRGEMTYAGKQIPPASAGGAIGLTKGSTNLGWAGEAGGEAVAILRNPRSVQSGGGGGNLSISIDVHSTRGVITPGVARDIMRELGPLLTMYLQRQGILPRVGTPLRG